MSKPIIKFKGVRYSVGGNQGWRPQLESATKFTDLQVAEEIVLAKRMSMSPEELLHCIKTVITTVPELVATDGIVREFKSLLCWNRTASGKLDSQAGAWNATCRAKVKLQQLKDCKFDIDARFVNEIDAPTAKLDNVTFIGANEVYNVLKKGTAFAAYGRNMQMITGDEATLTVNGTKHTLTCTSSDVAHAVFSWPAAITGIESGTPALFEMTSRGGSAEGVWAYNKKNVVILVEDVPTTAFTKIVDAEHSSSNTDYIGSTSTGYGLYGTKLGVTGYQLEVKYKSSEAGEWQDHPSYDVMVAEDGMIGITTQPTASQINAVKFKFKVTTSFGTAEREVAVTY